MKLINWSWNVDIGGKIVMLGIEIKILSWQYWSEHIEIKLLKSKYGNWGERIQWKYWNRNINIFKVTCWNYTTEVKLLK